MDWTQFGIVWHQKIGVSAPFFIIFNWYFAFLFHPWSFNWVTGYMMIWNFISLSLSWPAKVKAQISGMTLQKILPKQDKQDRMRTGGLHSGVGWVIHAKVEKYEHNEYYDQKSNTNEEAFKDVYHAAEVTVLMMHGRDDVDFKVAIICINVYIYMLLYIWIIFPFI